MGQKPWVLADRGDIQSLGTCDTAMVQGFSSPAAVYLLFLLAGICALFEAGIPTFGIAGLMSAAFGFVAVQGIIAGDLVWWPLAVAGLSILSTCLPLALHHRFRTVEIGAVATFGMSSLIYAVVNENWLSLLLAVIATGIFALGLDRLFAMIERTNNAPQLIGLDALIGKRAEVRRWEGRKGTVLVDGAYWDATGAEDLAIGSHVQVVSHEGMRLAVIPTSAPKVDW